MKHVLFALFDSPQRAAAALREVRRAGIHSDDFSIIAHRGVLDEDDLSVKETDSRQGFSRGVLFGSVAGAVTAGLLAGPFGLIGVGPLAAALFGGAAGGAYGALGAGLAGLGVPDKTLQQWAAELEAGKVVVTVTVKGSEREATVESIFAAHDAEELRKQSI